MKPVSSVVVDSFAWLKPIESSLKELEEEDGVSFYRVIASHADVKNRNGRTYTQDEMERAAASLSERPLDINHDDERTLEYPDNRVLVAREENGVLEALIQIADPKIKQMIDSGEIASVSVDGIYLDQSNNTWDNEQPKSLHFRKLALLTRDTSPGDPLARIIKDSIARAHSKKYPQGQIQRLLLSSVPSHISQEYEIHPDFAKMPSSRQRQVQEKKTSDTQWSGSMVNDLPDSSFAVIEPGGQKDSDGKTTPRSLRHLPYKDASGKVDAPHLRNALARLSQTQIPSNLMAQAKSKLLSAAKSAGIQSSLADALITHRSNAKVKVFKERYGHLLFQTKDDWILIDPSGDEDVPDVEGGSATNAQDDDSAVTSKQVNPDTTDTPVNDRAHEADGGEKDWGADKNGKKEPFPGAAPPFKKDAEDAASTAQTGTMMSQEEEQPDDDEEEDDDGEQEEDDNEKPSSSSSSGQETEDAGDDDDNSDDKTIVGSAPEDAVGGASAAYGAQFAGHHDLPTTKDGSSSSSSSSSSTGFLANGNTTPPAALHNQTGNEAGGHGDDPHPRDPNLKRLPPDGHGDNDDGGDVKTILKGTPPAGTVDSFTISLLDADVVIPGQFNPHSASDPRTNMLNPEQTTGTLGAGGGVNPDDSVNQVTRQSTGSTSGKAHGVSDSINFRSANSSLDNHDMASDTKQEGQQQVVTTTTAAQQQPVKDSSSSPAAAAAKMLQVKVDVSELKETVSALVGVVKEMVETQKARDSPKNVFGSPVKEAYYESNKDRYAKIWNGLKAVKDDITSSSASNALGQVWLPDMIVLPVDLPANLRNFCQVVMIEKGADRVYFTRITTPKFASLSEDTAPSDASQTVDRITSTPTETGAKQRVSYIVLESSTPDIVAAVERAFMVGAILDEDNNIITALEAATPAKALYGDETVTAEGSVTSSMTFKAARLASAAKYIQSVGKYVVNPGDLIAVLSPVQFDGLLKDTQVSNWYQFGSYAPIQQGTIPQVYGVDVVKSTQVVQGVGASSIVTYHAWVWLKPQAKGAYGLGLGGAVGLGISRDLLIETWRRVDERDLYIVASHRIAAAVIQPNATVMIDTA